MSTYGNPEEYSDELRRIIFCVKKLRALKPGHQTDWKSAAECHMRYSNLHGKPALTLTITLSPTGCAWARKGGCTMCGEFEGSFKRTDLLDHPELHVAQFAASVGDERVWQVVNDERAPLEWIRIYQEGNYTNLDEVNIQSQEKILRLALRIKDVRRITIESRPEYITDRSVTFLKKIFDGSDVELEIGMGLEAQDRVIRNICINKQGSNDQFRRAVNLLAKSGFRSLAYVLLKPPFLSEEEAIVEAIKTIHFAADIGFSRISFEPMSIHSYTLVDALAKSGIYQPPWLWSVVEVVKACHGVGGMLGIGGIGYYPLPVEYCRNRCEDEPACSDAFTRAIINWNATRDVEVFSGLSCACKRGWMIDCGDKPLPLKARIGEQLTAVEKIIDRNEYSPAILSQSGSVARTRQRRLLMSYYQP